MALSFKKARGRHQRATGDDLSVNRTYSTYESCQNASGTKFFSTPPHQQGMMYLRWAENRWRRKLWNRTEVCEERGADGRMCMVVTPLIGRQEEGKKGLLNE